MTAEFPREHRPSDLDQDLSDGYDREKELEGTKELDTEDQRTPFERDRDRILYSREFRRLKDVTQVARAGETYLYHDRLTHSLKVGQVGRRLAELLRKFYSEEFDNLEGSSLTWRNKGRIGDIVTGCRARWNARIGHRFDG